MGIAKTQQCVAYGKMSEKKICFRLCLLGETLAAKISCKNNLLVPKVGIVTTTGWRKLMET